MWKTMNEPERFPSSESVSECITDYLSASNTNWDAPFSFSQTYCDAPKPYLDVEGIGAIDLPFAAELDCGTQTSVSDAGSAVAEYVWDIDARKVEYMGMEWEAFIGNVVADACRAFKIDGESSKSFCELRMVSLQDATSKELCHTPFREAERDGIMATIAVVLPSAKITGGNITLSHSGRTVECQCVNDQTTVIGWFNDVIPSMEPITSGRRLVFTYDFALAEPPCVVVPTEAEADARLSLALERWCKGARDWPPRLAVLLSHRYSPADLCIGALKGVDLQSVTAFSRLASQHDLVLGLGNVRWTTSHSLHLTHVVDLTGTPIVETLDLPRHHETGPGFVQMIKTGLRYEVDEFTNIEEKLHGQEYHRVALVVWPKHYQLHILLPDRRTDITDMTRDSLRNIQSRTPNTEQWALIDAVFGYKWYWWQGYMVSNECSRIACLWRDLALWECAIKLCVDQQGLSTVSEETKLEAVRVFGFSQVQASFERMLHADKSNTRRLDFLSMATKKWHIAAWAADHTRKVLLALQPPTQQECTAIVQAALAAGGMCFIKDSLCPHICAIAGGKFLLDFAEEVASVVAPDELMRDAVINAVVSTWIDKAKFSDHQKDTTMVTDGNCQEYLVDLKRFITICLRFDYCDLIQRILSSAATTAREQHSIYSKGQCAMYLLHPLVEFLLPLQHAHTEEIPRSEVEALRRLSALLWWQWICVPTKEIGNWECYAKYVLITTVQKDENPDLFMEVALPVLETAQISARSDVTTAEHVVRLAYVIWEQLHSRLAFSLKYEGQTINQSLYSLMERLVTEAEMDWDPDVVCLALRLARDLGGSLTRTILDRLLAPQEMTYGWCKCVLDRVVEELGAWASRNGCLDAFAEVFQRILCAWKDNVWVPPPPIEANLQELLDRVGEWDCDCDSCESARRFLSLYSTESDIEWEEMGANSRRHIVRKLEKFAEELVEWHAEVPDRNPEWESTTRYKSLFLEKRKPLRAHVEWAEEHHIGAQMACRLGDPMAIKRLLGKEYWPLVKAMRPYDKLTPSGKESAAPPTPRIEVPSSEQELEDVQPPCKKQKQEHDADVVAEFASAFQSFASNRKIV
ncbi:hypothetical protein PsYK624_034200 [Phanerochaete sordida]|uniref:Uncharacterized protein n=1 Tax=Phanerochaete sordida TaxID=48140 RepID=A0A9P3G1L1_9APHY|nr:hypothetical protein PsYK624_034200 [Phanerochaete sordida]